MIRKAIILILFIFSFSVVHAQDSYIKNRWSFKAGYARYPGPEYPMFGKKETYNNFRLEANYGVLNFLEIGAHLGYCRSLAFNFNQADSSVSLLKLNTPFFGLDINVQLLPFLIKKPDFRFDLYLLGRYGGYYLPAPDHSSVMRGFYPEIRHGAGLAFYLTKQVGIFAEYSFTKLQIDQGALRYGISIKLKNKGS